MILVTFDDAVNHTVYERINLIRGHTNPDGSPAAFTFYVSNNYTNYWQLHELHSDGHEIAIHTITHNTGMGTTYERWIEEIVACREAIFRLAGIPMADLRGFRAPYLRFNEHMFHALSDLGFDYDCSATEELGQMHSVDEANFIWPYTLHDGIQQNIWTGTGPTRSLPDLFEVPMWSMVEPDGSRQHNMDPAGSREELVALFKHNLLSRYNGNRAPMGIWLHASPFLNTDENVSAMNEFLEWALELPDVWVVGVGTAIDWIKNPTPASSVLAEGTLGSQTYEPIPNEDAYQVSFPFGPVRAIVPPLAYPDYHTVFLQEMEVQDVTVEIVAPSQASGYFQAELRVSHNHSTPFVNWQIYVALGDATLGSAWDGADYQQLSDGTYLFVPGWKGVDIPAGQTPVATLGITGNSEDVGPATGTFYIAGYPTPVLAIQSSDDPDTLQLSWNKTSSIYDLEVAASNEGPWSLLQTIYGKESVDIEKSYGEACYRLRDNQQSVSEPLYVSAESLVLAVAVADEIGGTVSVSPLRDEYLMGETVTITATPAVGYRFVTWRGDAEGDENPLTLIMESPQTLNAHFALLNYTVTFDLADKATRTGGAELVQSIEHGSPALLPIIEANPGWLFLGWDAAAENITSETTFVAQFDPDHADDDDDELSNYEEIVIHGTDPNNPDTSGDGILDGEAVAAGLNPLADHSAVINFVANNPRRFGIDGEDSAILRQEGVDQVLANPAAYDLHSEASIMDLNVGGLMLQRGSQGFELKFQLEMSTDLVHWQPVETITRLLAPAGDKVFLRVRTSKP